MLCGIGYTEGVTDPIWKSPCEYIWLDQCDALDYWLLARKRHHAVHSFWSVGAIWHSRRSNRPYLEITVCEYIWLCLLESRKYLCKITCIIASYSFGLFEQIAMTIESCVCAKFVMFELWSSIYDLVDWLCVIWIMRILWAIPS